MAFKKTRDSSKTTKHSYANFSKSIFDSFSLSQTKNVLIFDHFTKGHGNSFHAKINYLRPFED
jgi:hypothetical protein